MTEVLQAGGSGFNAGPDVWFLLYCSCIRDGIGPKADGQSDGRSRRRCRAHFILRLQVWMSVNKISSWIFSKLSFFCHGCIKIDPKFTWPGLWTSFSTKNKLLLPDCFCFFVFRRHLVADGGRSSSEEWGLCSCSDRRRPPGGQIPRSSDPAQAAIVTKVSITVFVRAP